MHIKIGRRLVPHALERALHRNSPFDARGALTAAAPPFEVIFDLSDVEWVDFGAAAQIVLLAQRLTQSDVRVVIHFPSRRADLVEETNAQNASKGQQGEIPALSRRLRATAFLRYLRFPEALEALSNRASPNKISLLCDGETQTFSEGVVGSQEQYLNVFPLKWLNLRDEEGRAEMIAFLTAFLSSNYKQGHGVSRKDASALAETVLFELIENVEAHSNSDAEALVCGWARESAHGILQQDYLPEEGHFLSWIGNYHGSMVELFVGDAGIGIASSLQQAYLATYPESQKFTGKVDFQRRVIDWAFDRFSSAKKVDPIERGVRGLYRVQRIVNRYQGLISIRSHKAVICRDHSYDNNYRITKSLAPYAYFPGTILRIRLAPAAHKYLLRQHTDSAWLDIVPDDDKSVRLLFLDGICETGLTEEAKKKLVLHMTGAPESRPRRLYVVFRGGIYNKYALEHALRFLCAINGPAALIVFGLPASLTQLDEAVDSVNSTMGRGRNHQGDEPHNVDVHVDPILIVASSGEAFWLGGDNEIRICLSALLETSSTLSFKSLWKKLDSTQLFNSASKRLKTARRLREYSNSVRINASPANHLPADSSSWYEQDDVQVQLLIGPSKFVALVRKRTKDLITHKKRKVDGVEREGPYLTPTLRVVDMWVNVNHFVQTERAICVEAVGQALTYLIRRALGDEFVDLLMSDASSSRLIRQYLLDALPLNGSIEPFEIESDSELQQMASGHKTAIIYVDVISSAESVRRTIHFALRRGYRVLAVACVLDAREKPGAEIITWGEKIPSVWLCNVAPPSNSLAPQFIVDPSLILERVERPKKTTEAPLLQELAKIFQETQSTRLAHSRRANGRHLTFSVVPERFLKNDFLREELGRRILSWYTPLSLARQPHSTGRANNADPNPVIFLVPVDDSTSDTWRQAVTEFLQKALPGHLLQIKFVRRITVEKSTVIRHQDVPLFNPDQLAIVFDWGAVTGNTISQMALTAGRRGACGVLICVLISQMQDSDHNFLASISELEIEKELPKSDDLFAETKIVSTAIPSKFIWLAQFPLGHYAPSECPVCHLIGELSQLHPQTAFLKNFRDAEIEKLEERGLLAGRREISGNRKLPQVPIDAVAIASLRTKLAASSLSTESRLAAVNYLEDLLARAANLPAWRDEAASILSLLWIESQWLRRPPLQFMVAKNILAQICLLVISDKDVPEDIRVLAASLLRKVSKNSFISSLTNMLQAAKEIPRLQQAIFFGLFSFLAKEYHESPQMLLPALDELKRAGKNVIDVASPHAFLEAKDTIDYLFDEFQFLLGRAYARNYSAKEAFYKLKDLLTKKYGPHHEPARMIIFMALTSARARIDEAFNSANATTGARLDPQQRERLAKSSQDWQLCRTFLVNKLIPLLIPLRSILSSEEAQKFFPEEDGKWLLDLIDRHSKGLAKQLPLTGACKILKDFGNDDSVPITEARNAWQLYKTEVDRFSANLLKAAASGISGPSRLADFLARVPAEVGSCLTRGFEMSSLVESTQLQLSSGLNLFTSKDEIFCTVELLTRVFDELFTNVRRHGEDQFGEGHLRACQISHTKNNDMIRITFSNESASEQMRKDTTRLHGLTLLQSQLAPFGATLEWTMNRANDKGQQFQVEIGLVLWSV